MSNKKKFAKDFYEIQRKQWQKSLLLFLILFIFYFFLVGFVSFIFIISLGLFMPGISLLAGNSLQYFFLINFILAIVVAAFHFYDARFHGAKFIRKRLQATVPDTNDRYHKQFINTIDEMRIAAGLPKVTPYIIPAFAINSMALIEADKTPTIIVTEGLLAEFTRDELQAVIAHELAHIIRGDTFYITLVCSLANFFERLREMAEPHDRPQGCRAPQPYGMTFSPERGAFGLSAALTVNGWGLLAWKKSFLCSFLLPGFGQKISRKELRLQLESFLKFVPVSESYIIKNQ